MEEESEGRSYAETPTWTVATMVTFMVSFGFFFHRSLKQVGKWLKRTKRKSLLAALEKMKLMIFGLLSLLMGHWIIVVAKICIKSSDLSSKFYPCALKSDTGSIEHFIVSGSDYLNKSVFREQVDTGRYSYCPEGEESFVSYESLEQLHRFLFVPAVTHVSYCFVTIALAMIKIYSWRTWVNQAKSMAIQCSQAFMRVIWNSSPFNLQLCFSRQFWSSINRADYMALRLGFITNHELPLSYDFHNYMLRSLDEEFRDIVGISVPLWIYAILCIFLDFHGTDAYFWLSFLPAILVGTKLHRVVVKLAVEIMDTCPATGSHHFKLRDELFWFGKPKLLLLLIQLISFQNAFEMATFLWSMWEIKEAHCFMENHVFLVIRLAFGIVSQCWCSFVTFPLYVIITQMGSRFKKSVVSENVRRSLHGWQRRVKARHSSSLLGATSIRSLFSLGDGTPSTHNVSSSHMKRSSSRFEDPSALHQPASVAQNQTFELQPRFQKLEDLHFSDPFYYSSDDDGDDHEDNNNLKDGSCLFPPH